MNLKQSLLLAAALSVGFAVSSVSAQDRDDYYHGGALEAHKHGYEHGYRDGYAYGRDAKTRGVALNFRTEAYEDGGRGYAPAFGGRDEFRDGYRDGYQKGATDGYNNTQTRLRETYEWRDRDFDPDRVHEDRYDGAYVQRRFGYQDVASDIGYRDGVNAGLKDFNERHSFRPQEHDSWKDGNHGYAGSFGSKEEYRREYRAAYEAGYRDGYRR